mmetsp:Transcript_2588/g.9372  ORF Transcript_2588/g.9372 Transcript_2588/m.9372 type:complete len:144 (+) Transcript_2588:249-680(+)
MLHAAKQARKRRMRYVQACEFAHCHASLSPHPKTRKLSTDEKRSCHSPPTEHLGKPQPTRGMRLYFKSTEGDPHPKKTKETSPACARAIGRALQCFSRGDCWAYLCLYPHPIMVSLCPVLYLTQQPSCRSETAMELCLLVASC